MPRPNKAFRRNKINAAAAWKRGDRKEAYGLWKKAADGMKELREKKRTRHQVKEEPAPAAEAPAES